MMVWLWIGLAMAGDALSYTLQPAAIAGKGWPTVVLMPNVHGDLDVSVECAGRRWGGPIDIAPASEVRLPLEGLADGVHTCSVSLSLHAADGSQGSMGFEFEAAVLPVLQLEAGTEDVDLVARRVMVRADRPLQEVSLEVTGLEGTMVERVPGRPVGKLAQLSWKTDAEVLQLRVTGTDQWGLRSQLTLTPWSYAIEHEDVVFASGEAELPAGEVHKLEATWSEVQSVLARFGDVVDIKLYVAGFTDSVGSSDANQALSARRARAIASWFRARGFRRPIQFQGLGEKGQAVTTADGVDEPRNRRAMYVLAASAPVASPTLPFGPWRTLP